MYGRTNILKESQIYGHTNILKESKIYGCTNVLKESKITQGSKKAPSGRPGQVDFPFGQVTFSPYLPHGQGPRQAVH